jgi:hypothetical protein
MIRIVKKNISKAADGVNNPVLAFCNHEDSLEFSRQQEPDLMTSYADTD